MSKVVTITDVIFNGLNKMYEDKKNGYVSSNGFADTLQNITSLYEMQCKNGKHTKDDIESYMALLPGSSELFSYNHIGIKESTVLANEKLNNIIKTMDEKEITKVM